MNTDAVMVLLIVESLLLLVAVVLGFLMGVHSREQDREDINHGLFRSETRTTTFYDDVVDAETVEDEVHTDEEEDRQQYATLPINPDTPPTWKTYNPRNPNAEPKFCRCHGWPIREGQKVLWWPNPESGGVDLLCEDGVAEAEAVKNK